MENKFKKFSLVSLGCSKNLTDAEKMSGILKNAGYERIENESEADFIIVNTCTFIEAAQTESIECILELSEYKKIGKAKALIVTGCIGQRYKEQVLREIPEVDAVIGVNEYHKIAEVLEKLENGEKDIILCSDSICDVEDLPKEQLTPKYTGFLKIAEGCDNRCTYCVIPSVRGKFRSRKKEDIIKEAKEMAEKGCSEIVVIAQDTTAYGIDLYGEYKLSELLRELCQIEKIKWVRVHYCYPERITDELIEVFKTEDKLCKYFDIPIQHCNDDILRRMNRHTNKKQITELIKKIRREIPEAVIRTSLIVGFPGETEESFSELCDFVKEIEFERLGVFTYSREEDTPAYSFENQIDEEEKAKRRDTVMLLQSDIAEARNNKKVGSVITVLTEGRDEIIKSYYGRSYADSEEIDGKVFFKSDKPIGPGEFVKVKIEQAMEYDLFGKVMGN